MVYSDCGGIIVSEVIDSRQICNTTIWQTSYCSTLNLANLNGFTLFLICKPTRSSNYLPKDSDFAILKLKSS